MDVDDSDGELELSGISVARSDGFHHQVNHKDPSVYALSRVFPPLLKSFPIRTLKIIFCLILE